MRGLEGNEGNDGTGVFIGCAVALGVGGDGNE